MRKQFPALIVVLMLVFPSSASALETDELIAIAAMPLAVAAVADLADVPRTELITTVTTLNQAAVPAPQFIEVVRYSPIAFVDAREPRFVTYVTREYDRGLVGDSLAMSIANRYQFYGVDEVNVVDPPDITVVERTILPPVVVTRFQPVEFNPLALIAMPLAVAAVSEITDVPRSDLIDLVAMLNQALVPAPQFVEIVRYSPMVLVDPALEPQFMTFVSTEFDRGITGSALAFAIGDRFRTVGIDEINLVNPPTRVIVDREVVVPPVVINRVVEVTGHPHGGPPGQLKKQIGVQTGAEVVHGTRRGKSDRDRVVVRRDDDDGRDRKSGRERTRVVRPRERDRDDDDRGRSRVVKPRKQDAPKVEKRKVERREIKQRPQKIEKHSTSGGGKPDKGQQGQGKGKGKGKG